MAVGFQSVGSFTTAFTRMFGRSPTAYRESFPPAVAWAMIPGCVTRVYGRPEYRKERTFREDADAATAIASSADDIDPVDEPAESAEEALV
jgi:hypothetical protein